MCESMTAAKKAMKRIGRRACSAALAVGCLGWLFNVSSCNTTGVTSASLPNPTTLPDAPPAVSESWTGIVPVGGSVWYSFSLAKRGTVQVTLLSVSGQDVSPDATLGLAVGVPLEKGCTIGTPTSAQAGSSPQVTGSYDAGVLCASVSDLGELAAPAVVSLVIDHP